MDFPQISVTISPSLVPVVERLTDFGEQTAEELGRFVVAQVLEELERHVRPAAVGERVLELLEALARTGRGISHRTRRARLWTMMQALAR